MIKMIKNKNKLRPNNEEHKKKYLEKTPLVYYNFYPFPAELLFQKLSVSHFAFYGYRDINVLHELQRVTVDK